ncbi:MAG TPA: ABC transporter permease [Psychromonas hadalis]|nr:ABC transporter permease [Psychromonas hadalis]
MSWQEIWIAFKTICLKEILRFSRIWIQTILPPAITMSLYFVIFGNLIGRAIGEMDGFQYIDYIVPGLIMMSVITNSYSNVVSSFFSSKMHGHVQELLISPTPNIMILLGFVAGGVARGLGVGVIVTLVALFFTDINIQHPIMTLAVVILTSFLFSIAGFINAIFAKSFDAVNIVPVFILTPLTYLGGVFYSINMLSPFWRDVSLFNPVLYMVNGFRYGILGVSDISPSASFTLLLVFIGILLSLAIFLLKRGIGLRE